MASSSDPRELPPEVREAYLAWNPGGGWVVPSLAYSAGWLAGRASSPAPDAKRLARMIFETDRSREVEAGLVREADALTWDDWAENPSHFPWKRGEFVDLVESALAAVASSPVPEGGDFEREHDLLLKERDPEFPGSLAMQLRDVAQQLEVAKGGAAEAHLDALRWKADMEVWNHEGEHVWLKQDTPRTIADCCLYEHPCKRHDRRAVPVSVGDESVSLYCELCAMYVPTKQEPHISAENPNPHRANYRSRGEAISDLKLQANHGDDRAQQLRSHIEATDDGGW